MTFKINFNEIGELVYEWLVAQGKVKDEPEQIFFRLGELKFTDEGLDPEESNVCVFISENN